MSIAMLAGLDGLRGARLGGALRRRETASTRSTSSRTLKGLPT